MKAVESNDQSDRGLSNEQEKTKNSYLAPKRSVSEFFCRLFSCCRHSANNSKSTQKPTSKSGGFARLQDIPQAQHPIFSVDIEDLDGMPPLDLDSPSSGI